MRCGAFKLDSEPTGGHRHIPEDKDPRSWHLHLQVTSTQALSRVDMSARNDQWPQTRVGFNWKSEETMEETYS